MSKVSKKRYVDKVHVVEIESVETWMARTGKTIIKLPSAPMEPEVNVIRKTTQGGPAVFLSLEEADLFFGEPSKKKKKAKKKQSSSTKINLDALPPALRAKFVSKLKGEVNGEGYEKEIESIEKEDFSCSGIGIGLKDI
jgi:hypothetical protein